MPAMIPTKAELESMPWHARQKALQRIRHLIKALDGFIPMEEPQPASQPAIQVVKAEQFNRQVMEAAKFWEQVMGPDPDAEAHWAALERVVRGHDH